MTRFALLATAATLALAPAALHAQPVGRLSNSAPDGAMLGFLMTDGSIIYQGFGLADWWKLSPDRNGSYLDATWSQVANMPYSPQYPSGAVLADGRMLVEGGEYTAVNNTLVFTFTNQGAIYDPNANAWTTVKAPGIFPYIGDSPSSVLPNGLYLLGDKLNKLAATLDPKTLKWTEVGTAGKIDHNAEEGWTLLPDGTILTVDVTARPNTEIYYPAAGEWESAGETPVLLASPREVGPIKFGPNDSRTYVPAGETGPEILRPDGTVFAAGSILAGSDNIAHSGVYRPAHGGIPGSWTRGPDFLAGDDPGDNYAVLEPNGKVLITTSTLTGEQREDSEIDFLDAKLGGGASSAKMTAQTAVGPGNGAPYRIYEFDGTNLVLQPLIIRSLIMPHLLVLPTGEIIVDGFGLIEPEGGPAPSWAPVITKSPPVLAAGLTYRIDGLRFNGPSQAQQFGDENTTAENYLLVRVTNSITGHVTYCRTHDHSTMGVATGLLPVYTYFDVPDGIEPGSSKIEVVADGIASEAKTVDVK